MPVEINIHADFNMLPFLSNQLCDVQKNKHFIADCVLQVR